MIYEFQTRVRYSECDEKGYATIQALTCYLQDCSIFHSEDVGLSVDWFTQAGRVWLLLSWQLDILKRPKVGEVITVGTTPYGMRGVFGYRSFQITGQDGTVYLNGDSTWCLVDIATQSPTWVDEFYSEKYGLGEKVPVTKVPKRIRPNGDPEELEPIVVHRHHLDTNHHVNNSEYVVMGLEQAESLGAVSMLRVEYKTQAFLGDIIYPKRYLTGNQCVISLENQEGKPYAMVEITGAQ